MSTLVVAVRFAWACLVPLLSCQLGGCKIVAIGPTTVCILGQKIIMMELTMDVFRLMGDLGF